MARILNRILASSLEEAASRAADSRFHLQRRRATFHAERMCL